MATIMNQMSNTGTRTITQRYDIEQLIPNQNVLNAENKLNLPKSYHKMHKTDIENVKTTSPYWKKFIEECTPDQVENATEVYLQFEADKTNVGDILQFLNVCIYDCPKLQLLSIGFYCNRFPKRNTKLEEFLIDQYEEFEGQIDKEMSIAFSIGSSSAPKDKIHKMDCSFRCAAQN